MQARPQADAPAASRRVLIVDDNEINLKVGVIFLQKLACDVVSATGGLEALRLVQEQDFDLVLMDCQMPGVDGFETTQSIRRWEAVNRRRPMRIVAVTANGADAQVRCLAAGMDAMLQKPFRLSDFRSLLEGHAGGLPAHLSGGPETQKPRGGLDREHAMRVSDQNPELLTMLAKAFLDQYEVSIGGMREAVLRRDAEALRQQAHKLKGSISVFTAGGPYLTLRALEQFPCPPEWGPLERSLIDFETEMSAFLPELAGAVWDCAVAPDSPAAAVPSGDRPPAAVP